MDPILFALSQASLQLTLLHGKLLDRVHAAHTLASERDSIAFQLPIIAQNKRDIDRTFSAIHAANNPLPMPSNAVMAELKAATAALSAAVAASEKSDALIALALTLGGIAARIQST